MPQFYPAQPLQFMEGLLDPVIGGWLDNPPLVVQRPTGDNGGSRTTSTVLSWSSVTAGNLIVIEFVCENNGSLPSTPAGYTLWASGHLNNSAVLTTSIYYKTAAGGETGATITHGTNFSCWVMREFSNASGSPEFGTPSVANTANPNPPSLTPSGGTKNYLWIAGCTSPPVSVSAFPTNYINGVTSVSGSGTIAQNASAERTLSASSEDPGTFTLGSAQRSTAYTYSVSP